MTMPSWKRGISPKAPVSLLISEPRLLSRVGTVFLRKVLNRQTKANKQNASNTRTDPVVENGWSTRGFSGSCDDPEATSREPRP